MQHDGPRRHEQVTADEELHAVIAGALAAYLQREVQPVATSTFAWANPAHFQGRDVGAPWPVGLITWSQAEQPR